jgi:dipeptidyl aminopeptidase/acylaminoacyl peptidase
MPANPTVRTTHAPRSAQPFNPKLSSMEKDTLAFGTWPSPISAAMTSASDTRLRNLQVTGSAIFWLEVRPAEGGRGVVVRWTKEHGARDMTPAGSNVGSRVHEYGGGEYRCCGDAIVYSEKSDDSIWLIEADRPPRMIVAVPGCRYADFEFDVARARIYAVCEDHRGRSPVDPANRIVAIDHAPADPAQNAGRTVFDASDFAASPRLSPDGTRLAWIVWDHPNMPWDHTRLLVADVDDVARPNVVAGQTPQAIEQIAWSDDSQTLYFTSDRTGWANVYALRVRTAAIEPLAAAPNDFSHPAWQFRAVSIAPSSAGRVLSAYIENGIRMAALLEAGRFTALALGAVQDVPQPFGDGLAYIAEPPDAPATIRLTTAVQTEAATLRSAAPALLSLADISIGEPMTFPVGDGERTHAFFYAPRNERCAGPAGERPPLIITSHGGPTSMRTNAFNLAIQFWTTRGFAVADVNYRGSTGYGSIYRNRLRGQWGIVDVEDCVAVAQGLIDAGTVDANRVAIRGGSSSGFTTLAALAASGVFAAGASYYPVTDLTVFTGETHKFESRYVDGLIGPADAIDLYRSRSPVANAANIVAPVVIFQGLDDKVVPPNQSERMVAALRVNGTPVDYHAYAGEGHGFLKAETLQHALETELAFYARTFKCNLTASA